MSGAASSKGKSAGTTPAAGAGAAREVIQDWADGEGGYTFERGRMEAAVRSICFDQPATFKPPAPAGAGAGASAGPAAKSATGSVKLNKDDVELITRDLLIPKHEAERALTQNEGNLTEALKSLLTPASP